MKRENTNTIGNNAHIQPIKRLHKTLSVQALAYCLVFFLPMFGLQLQKLTCECIIKNSGRGVFLS